MIFPIFLSSLTAQMPNDAETLREKVFLEAGQSTLIYVDEVLHKRKTPVLDSLTLADELLSRISEASCFLCILAGSSHGSLLPVDDALTSVSYFEIELFAAALQRKPIYLLVHESFEPIPQLASLLDILRFAFPDWRDIKELNDKDIVDAAKKIADSVSDASKISTRKFPTVFSSTVNRIAQAFYTSRGRDRQNVMFLGGQQVGINRPANVDLVRHLLVEIKNRQNQQERLSRLWLAVRELNTPALNIKPDTEAIALLEDVLELWSGAGAWYGLNADMHLGCLAALNSVYELRQKRKSLGALPSHVLPYPAGALASAKFNIAKHLTSIRDRRERLTDAFKDIEVAILHEKMDRSGLLAVRASINRRLGNVFVAASDLEKSLAIRKQMGMLEFELGATYSELGFTYLYSLQFRKGLKLCEKGVEMLKAGQANPSDIARALRKLAVAYTVNANIQKARQAFEKSQEIAQNSNAHDQRR